MLEAEAAGNVTPFAPRRALSLRGLAHRVEALEDRLASLAADLASIRQLLSQQASEPAYDPKRDQLRATLADLMVEREVLARHVAELRTERDALRGDVSALRRGPAHPGTRLSRARHEPHGSSNDATLQEDVEELHPATGHASPDGVGDGPDAAAG